MRFFPLTFSINFFELLDNSVSKSLFEYDGTGDFVDLNSDEIRALIPYLQDWNEHSVWGSDPSQEFIDAGWWWSYRFFTQNLLLTLAGDPWMMGDCATPENDWEMLYEFQKTYTY